MSKQEYFSMSQLNCFLISNRNVFKILNRAYNHTTRVCRRPLVEECLPSYDGGYSAPGAAAEPELVCETFYETECRTVKFGENICILLKH